MDFNKLNCYFRFSKEQRAGIFSLFLVIAFLQLGYYYCDGLAVLSKQSDSGKQQWMSLQAEIDSLKSGSVTAVQKVYPFNPNFITDYKGYKLGMSVQEIDRLLAYRKEDKYVNSAAEFQKVTQISDSLLRTIAPFFKFPDWVKNKKDYVAYKNKSYPIFEKKKKTPLIDLNIASQEDLVKIYGVGEVISKRILNLKESLGGFVSMEQVKEVWGLSPEVIDNLYSHFTVLPSNTIKKISINNASLKEMAQFPYFKYTLAKDIIIYRSMNGDFKNIEDLIKIKGFPVEKANIIALYLDFN
ncbi:ComEA family DNA-binding protein [Flavobacterium muglaense]|uniref:Helix-hairpin-helix domain-containing protein n=1 Tax=Flavobacterium muglaense TaxID=2764716 RepID=A0A923MXH0_9FLAO|nr:helix-hairpin-helix domain-containing protein [Flavobacterium muglaense]MBC5836380.1 helix-hairpin-helix domain-containing protein [Flavobacterium muglaense]MBC5842910.1 helix-hairpin-helix domain-containing protein [Flavobacterium muglaense]